MGFPKPPKIEKAQLLPERPEESERLDPEDIVLGSGDATQEQLGAGLLGKRALSRPLGLSGAGGV